MSPEAFPVVEVVALLEGDVVGADFVPLNVHEGVPFGNFLISFDDFKRGVAHKGS